MKNDVAIVLKALSLLEDDKNKKIDSLISKTDELLQCAESEKTLWRSMLCNNLGTKDIPEVKQVNLTFSDDIFALKNETWDEIVAWAYEHVRKNGLDPKKIVLPPTEHDLTAKDIVFAFLIATITIILPSLGGRHVSMQHWFNEIQKSADKGQLMGFFRVIFGDTPAQYLDIKDGGIYHRYVFGHDLLKAIPIGLNQEGLTGILRVFQHLLRDTFGKTGIPLPGSTLFLEIVASMTGANGISELIKNTDLSHSDLARYTGIRAVDGVTTVISTMLLWGYHKWQKTPEYSMKRPKMAIITYGLATFGVVIATSIPGLAPIFSFRSHINYVCLVGMVKNSWQLKSMAKKLKEENSKQISIIEEELEFIQGIHLDKGYL